MWDTILVWFITSLIGGAVVQLVNILLINPIVERRTRHNHKIEKVHNYLRSIADLVQLYRNYAQLRAVAVEDEQGKKVLNSDGVPIVETNFFQPDEEWLEVINATEGGELDKVIKSHRYLLNKQSPEISDLANDLDNSKTLNHEITNLRMSVSRIGNLLEMKESANVVHLFTEFVVAIEKADLQRSQLRKKLIDLRK